MIPVTLLVLMVTGRLPPLKQECIQALLKVVSYSIFIMMQFYDLTVHEMEHTEYESL